MSDKLVVLELDPGKLAEATEISMGVFRLRVSLEGQEHEVFALHDGTAIPVDFVVDLYSGAHARSGTPPPAARKRAAILTTSAPPASGVDRTGPRLCKLWVGLRRSICPPNRFSTRQRARVCACGCDSGRCWHCASELRRSGRRCRSEIDSTDISHRGTNTYTAAQVLVRSE